MPPIRSKKSINFNANLSKNILSINFHQNFAFDSWDFFLKFGNNVTMSVTKKLCLLDNMAFIK